MLGSGRSPTLIKGSLRSIPTRTILEAKTELQKCLMLSGRSKKEWSDLKNQTENSPSRKKFKTILSLKFCLKLVRRNPKLVNLDLSSHLEEKMSRLLGPQQQPQKSALKFAKRVRKPKLKLKTVPSGSLRLLSSPRWWIKKWKITR